MVKGKSPKTDIIAETSSSAEIESVDDFKRVNESIKEISYMIDNLKPKGTFETQVKLILQALSKHVEVLSTNWRSSSSGLCIKLENGRYFAKVHSMKDFTNSYFSG